MPIRTDETVPVRCDKDRTRMTKTRVSYSDIGFEGPAFQCAEPGCTRYFTDGRGYFDVVNGSVSGKFQRLCPNCKTPRFLSEVEQGEEIWRCPNTACMRA
jgi:hypothetical protein